MRAICDKIGLIAAQFMYLVTLSEPISLYLSSMRSYKVCWKKPEEYVDDNR